MFPKDKDGYKGVSQAAANNAANTTSMTQLAGKKRKRGQQQNTQTMTSTSTTG